MEHKHLGYDKAVELYNTKWWEGKTAYEIVNVQFYIAEVVMPFDLFHQSLEQVLGRPVWIHEMVNPDNLESELTGKKCAPTFEDILNLIPKEKQIIAVVL